jgi:hypothetical protein
MSKTPASGNKNWLLVKFREWHSWGGLGLSAFILLVAATGILLNHKDMFFHRGEAKKGPTGLLTASIDLDALPVSFARAMELSREHLGDGPFEKIELKDERGTLVYKVSRGEGREVQIDAKTGGVSSKYGLSLDARKAGMINWAKVVDDLHSGKLFGTAGKLMVDLTSGTIILLTLSGIYLWAVPWLRKRESARKRLAEPARAVAATTHPALQDLAARRAARLEAARAAAEPAEVASPG